MPLRRLMLKAIMNMQRRPTILGSFLVVASATTLLAAPPAGSRRDLVDLSGRGWSLWRDTEAQWEHDDIFLPPVVLAELPVNPPTGGWQTLSSAKNATAVSVPGTVEEYFWDEITGDTRADECAIVGDYKGVSWWWRTMDIPASAKGRRVLLRFENNRLRSEVFVDGKLVGYDIIGNSSFEIDITDSITPGEASTLAVRITDPGGNFSWPDPQVFTWGKHKIPMSHGFGGIMGGVDIRIVDPVYVDNVFVKNRPEMTTVDVRTTVQNTGKDATTGTMRIDVAPADDPDSPVFSQRYDNISLPQGEAQVEYRVSVPSAKLWHYDAPNLYVCRVTLQTADTVDQEAVRFGFRWLEVANRGTDDHFVLNGKRDFLLSSISWGFWPVNGAVPSPELAEKQIRQAKGLGLNMLSFHRHKGQGMVLDKADELGLLYYAEPGGHSCGKGDSFSATMARLKWLRMIEEFRNHPSLVIYNMINENGHTPKANQMQDMLDGHALDPTRFFTYTSGINPKNPPCKLHMVPYDDTQYTDGWWDFHHACSLGVSADSLYRDPTTYSYAFGDAMRREIVYLGEEGAVGAPPRLQLIAEYFKAAGHRNGWDGADYTRWFSAFDGYLARKKLKDLTVDDVTVGLGNTQYYYHGRMIENAKINDLVDGYVINGWECEKMENHSGIVDSFRNYKADPDILRRYTRPVYVAVKARQKIAHVSDAIDVDFFAVNGGGVLHGDYTLEADLIGPGDQVVKKDRWPVTVSRDRLGSLVKEGASFDLEGPAGSYTIAARLIDPNKAQQADGMERVFTVDWAAAKLPMQGAVIEPSDAIRSFLSAGFGTRVPAYEDGMGKLDYVLLDNSVGAIPAGTFSTPDGAPGLRLEYYNGRPDSKTLLATEVVRDIRKHDAPKGLEEKSVMIWTGTITPSESGHYVLCGDFTGGRINIWLDDAQIMNMAFGANRKARYADSKLFLMEAGRPYAFKVQYARESGSDSLELQWQRHVAGSTCDRILDRVAEDGTTLIVSGCNTATFAEELGKRGLVSYRGAMAVDVWWKAGGMFAVKHPLFKELPHNTGMSWEYQDLTKYEVRLSDEGLYTKDFESKRRGLLMEGEEVAAFCTDGHKFEVASTVSVVRHGKGRIVLSCLNIYPHLGSEAKSANTVKKILCNFLEYAAAPP